MAELSLTPFQIQAERRLRALLAELGRVNIERELRVGVVPFESPEEQTAVKLISEDLEVWIFDDEASFESSRGGDVFERYDYADENDLLNALLQQVREKLTKGRRIR